MSSNCDLSLATSSFSGCGYGSRAMFSRSRFNASCRSASVYGRSTSAAIGTDHGPFQKRSNTEERSRTTGPAAAMSRSRKLNSGCTSKYGSLMLRPPTIAIALSITISLLCIRWLTRSKSVRKPIRCEPRCAKGLNRRTSMFGWASSAAIVASRSFRLKSSIRIRTRTERSAARTRWSTRFRPVASVSQRKYWTSRVFCARSASATRAVKAGRPYRMMRNAELPGCCAAISATRLPIGVDS